MSRIIIVGKAASGKDYLKKKFTEKGFMPEVSMTTRPMREGEVNGMDYHFVSRDKFEQIIAEGHFYEYVEFNGNYYGTFEIEWHASSLFIMTPSGIAAIKPEDRQECFVVYLDIAYETRKERLMQRSDADSVERRLQADEEDFKDFTDFDFRVTNADF